MAKRKKTTLQPRRALFVKEYLKDLNATHAVIRAGYNTKAPNQIGYNIMQDPKVVKIINKEIAKRSVRTGISPKRVVRELARVALANLKDIVNKDLSKLSEEDAAALDSVKKKVNKLGEVTYTYRLSDKLKALELLMKHLGMIKLKVDGRIKHEHTINDLNDKDLSNELSAFLAGIDAARTTRKVKSGNSDGQTKLSGVRNNGQKRLPTS